MGIELLMSLYKQWGVTHYTFNVIVLISSEKSFSQLRDRIFLLLIVVLHVRALLLQFGQTFNLFVNGNHGGIVLK